MLKLAEGSGEPAWRGRVLYAIGMTYSDQGKWVHAETKFGEALEILEQELGPEHLDLARVCSGESSI